MQLFVVPITVNLLSEDPKFCPAMRCIREPARRENSPHRIDMIPVLPILLEDENTIVPGKNRSMQQSRASCSGSR